MAKAIVARARAAGALCGVALSLTAACSSAANTRLTPRATAEPGKVAGGYRLTGTINGGSDDLSRPGCFKYNIAHAAVTVRDERGTIIGTTTTGDNIVPSPTPIPEPAKSAIEQYERDEKAHESAPAISRQPTALPSDLQAINQKNAGLWVDYYGTCITTFALTVPKAMFYQVTIGTHGGPAHSYDELQTLGWHLDLTLQ